MPVIVTKYAPMTISGLLHSSLTLGASPDPLVFRHQSFVTSATTTGESLRLRGLPQITVTAVALDSQGFFWAGTQNGVARYDGVDTTKDPDKGAGLGLSIAQSSVRSMLGHHARAYNSEQRRRRIKGYRVFAAGAGTRLNRIVVCEVWCLIPQPAAVEIPMVCRF